MRRPVLLCLLLAGSLLVSEFLLPLRAENTPVFHYSMNNQPPAPAPPEFPLGLTPGMPRDKAIATLEALHLNRDNYDKESNLWAIPGLFHYKSFQPTMLSLAYKDKKLMQVTLVEPGITECQDIVPIVQDAVAYVQTQYLFPAENVKAASHYGSNSCVLYMKAGLTGWQAWNGDYAINVDSNWRDMKYTAYLSITYLPLYK